MLITWKSQRKTERSAITNHGNVWVLVNRKGDRNLIRSRDNRDLRWIFDSQVIDIQGE